MVRVRGAANHRAADRQPYSAFRPLLGKLLPCVGFDLQTNHPLRSGGPAPIMGPGLTMR